MRPPESFIGQPVRSLQTMLRVIAEDEGRSTSLIPDGFYGKQTQKEVSQFQTTRGIKVTGNADPETWQRIVLEYEPASIRIAEAEPLRIIMNPGKEYKNGDKSYNLHIAQVMLLALSEIYESISAPLVSGVLDDATYHSLASFQKLNDLPQTGNLDKITWKHLAMQYPLAVNHIETENRREINQRR